MSSDEASDPEETLAPLARIIYDEMNVEPRHMHEAIELAKWYLTNIREALVKRGLRSPAQNESPDAPDAR